MKSYDYFTLFSESRVNWKDSNLRSGFHTVSPPPSRFVGVQLSTTQSQFT